MRRKINEKDIEKIFYRFLKEENVFISYFKNLYRKYKMESNKQLSILLRAYQIDLIDYAFSWATTPQGYKFWQTINEKWKGVYSRAIFYYNDN